MRTRTVASLGGLVTAAVLVTAAPSYADPPTSDGCTFDQGLSTCVTTVVEQVLVGPITGSGSSNDGSPGGLFCLERFNPHYRVNNLVYTLTTTTTTTTVHQGAPLSHGIVVSKTSTTTTTTEYVSGGFACDASTE
jgi:hypothetical protein